MNGLTDKTILDPAFGGWSKAKPADDRETFHRLREFRGYGRPLLVSINRKSFLKTIAGRSTEEALRCRSPPPPRWQSSAAHT